MTDVYGGDIDSAKQYMANIAKEIDPGVTSGTLKLGNKSMSKVNELKYAKDAQNKLEMALSLKESGKEDEIVIDLWKY